MMKRTLAWGAAGAVFVATGVLCESPAAAQPARAEAAAKPEADKRQDKPRAGRWKQPMTPWGEPDLQGMWPLSHLIGTPFERPEEFGERYLLTDEEFAAAKAKVEARNESFSSRAIPAADDGQAMHMASLMTDPPNGRFPQLTELGKELQAKMGSSYKPGQTVFDGIADFDHWDRCITRGLPVSMLPRNYNNGIQIIQSPGYVVLVLEMAHEARVIPTDGRPTIEPAIKQWTGRVARALGRQHARGRDHELQRPHGHHESRACPARRGRCIRRRRTCGSSSASRARRTTRSSIR